MTSNEPIVKMKETEAMAELVSDLKNEVDGASQAFFELMRPIAKKMERTNFLTTYKGEMWSVNITNETIEFGLWV